MELDVHSKPRQCGRDCSVGLSADCRLLLAGLASDVDVTLPINCTVHVPPLLFVASQYLECDSYCVVCSALPPD